MELVKVRQVAPVADVKLKFELNMQLPFLTCRVYCTHSFECRDLMYSLTTFTVKLGSHDGDCLICLFYFY